MAKITLTFEDTLNGVLIKSDPGMEQLVALIESDHATNAHGYAMTAWLAICKASKPAGKRSSSTMH